MDLDSAAEELYGVPAEEFAEHRARLAAQAKAAGDKALAASIGKLRKPVLAAALVNELVRGRAGRADGADRARRADAQRAPAAARARAASAVRAAPAAAATADRTGPRRPPSRDGRTVTEPVLAQVRGTFEAAIADEAAEAAVLSGRLTTVLSYTGFGEVDVTDAVAVPVRRRHLRSVPAAGDAGESARDAPDRSRPTRTTLRAGGTSRAGTARPAGGHQAGTAKASTDKAGTGRAGGRAQQLGRAGPPAAPAAPRRAAAPGRGRACRSRPGAGGGQDEAEAPSSSTSRPPPGWSSCAPSWSRPRKQAGGPARPAGPPSGPGSTAEQEADRAAAALQAARDQLDESGSD